MSEPLPASRFYAVPEAGRMECPTCSRLIFWGKQKDSAKHWNPVASTLRCYGCQTVYVIGIIAWPATKNAGRRWGGKQPTDQRGTLRQLAEARQRAGGYWAKQARKKHDDPANVLVPGECSCAPLPWHPDCPVHGGMGDTLSPDPTDSANQVKEKPKDELLKEWEEGGGDTWPR